jgi:uncharacterized protein YijF (DUF1287 family)
LPHRNKILFLFLIAALACGICLAVLWLRPQPGGGVLPGPGGTPAKKPYYTAKDFGIQAVHSSVDFNHNGADDYTDLLLGAREDAEAVPKYDNSYYQGGYPPDSSGACTDLVWRAFRNAGYRLKDMVDRDIAEHTADYPVNGKPDPNIDFRRTADLKIYFERHAVSLTTDPKQTAEWQPGDIVTFGTHHIGIISDRRDKDGIPYLIHNAGQPQREEDALTRCGEISGHFRFDASRMDKSELIPFDSSK